MSDLAAYPPAAQVFNQAFVSRPALTTKDYLLNNAHGVITTKALTLSGNNSAVNASAYSITGVVEIFKLQGYVSTALQNCGTASIDVYDGSVSYPLTQASPGATLTNFAAGSYIGINDDPTVVLTGKNANVGFIVSSASRINAQPIITGKKAGSATQIRFNYTTTDTPTTGQITFECWWRPISSDGEITAT